MAWFCLVLSGLSEVIGVYGINRVNEKKGIQGYLILAAGFVLSLGLLSVAMRSISMGTAYAIWTGIGTVGSAVLGMLAFGESRDVRRLLFIGMVLAAAVGLKLIS
ncbi:QacE family quaternary ammonium compound efflux SMR transporter [Paenibacillus sp. J31TS4]|uniref:DMT family transporter n=1 Tax=Paenibacillus sp. J31TS4 TaxID=2807195 RepID=UPI001B1CD69F|nr:multidrug efflux SMR transporter [Paenibacillus sp. J31TS4]GIP38403.1 QacE family quaternary ammonium compound efflux SMR transporter [Paenibacillus sp. J31TS4]